MLSTTASKATNKARIKVLEDSVKSHDRAIRGYNGALGLGGRMAMVEKQLATINWGLRIIFVAVVYEILGRVGII